MEFLKNHYEKLVLGVIVIGLVVAAVMVSMQAESVGEEEVAGFGYETKAQPVDISTNLLALERFTNSAKLNFEEGHYLFNPDIWRRRPDGSFITGEDLGPKGVKIKEILPLVFSVKFLDTGSSSSSTRFAMQIVRVNAPDARGTTPTSMSTVMMSVGDENDLFKLLEVRPVDAPKEVLLEMKKDAQVVTLAKGQVFERIDGYIANLRYDAENRNFNNVRELSTITLLGETNKVVTLTSNELVLLKPATTLKTTLKYNAAP